MCYYQNIHTAHHHALLSIDAVQREQHRCGYQYPDYKADKCPLHACCRLTREVIISCGDVSLGTGCLAVETGTVMGTEGWREDDICGHAFVEDVFVPFPKGESILVAMEVEEDRDVDVCGERAGDVEVSVPVSGDKNVNKDVKTEVETMFRDGVWDTGVPVLEFWPVDDRGGVVRVYSEEPLGRDAYRDLKEREDDADDVNRTCAQDRDGSGYVWSWFPCVQRRQIRMRWW